MESTTSGFLFRDADGRFNPKCREIAGGVAFTLVAGSLTLAHLTLPNEGDEVVPRSVETGWLHSAHPPHIEQHTLTASVSMAPNPYFG